MIRIYKCEECKHEQEVLTKGQGENEKPREEPVCELCDSTKLEKKEGIADTNFKLKGSGWAASGYSK